MNLDQIQKVLAQKTAQEILQWIGVQFGTRACFSSSLGLEDQVITHLIYSNALPIEIFTIDTGRLFSETHSVLKETMNRYGKMIRIYRPDEIAVQNLVSEKGINSFYESIENRMECCSIRKVDPLKKALSGKTVWITGMRSEQSPDRKNLPLVEWDETNKIIKIHPLLNWTLEEVKRFIGENNIPYNSLHNHGFISIGCEPCTRAIKEGEDPRAGRWWWENNTKKECGLHQSQQH